MGEPEGSQQQVSEKQWDAACYDSSHSFVSKYGEGLIELLSPRAGERILDLGCGTGRLAHKIAAYGCDVTGLDCSIDMIEQARKSYPELRFEVGDATELDYSEAFDAVFSNAAIHWMKTPAVVTAGLFRALKPGGRFVAEFGGKGNLKSIHAALYRAVTAATYPAILEPSPKYYPSIGEYSTLLELQGFRVNQAIYFDRPTPLDGGEKGLQNWVEMFASNFLEAVPPEKRAGVIKGVEDELRAEAYRDGKWFADYKRIRVVAIRPPRR